MPARHPARYELSVSEERGVRSLHFGSPWVQGAMRIRRPFALELAYTREMMACLLLRPADGWPRSVLVVGLGTGSLVKFAHRELPGCRLTVVEIDERIPPLAARCFALPHDPDRIEIVVADAADYVEKGERGHPDERRFDLILLDGYGADGRAGHLDSERFYRACRNRLSAQGLLAANLMARSRGFMAAARRLCRVFEGRSMVFPSCESGNAVAFAAAGDAIDVGLSEMKLLARELKRRSGLDLIPTIARLEQAKPLAGGRLML